jgi:hypothetical protein
MEPSNYDKIPLCKIMYLFKGTGKLAEKSRGGHTTDQKMVMGHGLP